MIHSITAALCSIHILFDKYDCSYLSWLYHIQSWYGLTVAEVFHPRKNVHYISYGLAAGRSKIAPTIYIFKLFWIKTPLNISPPIYAFYYEVNSWSEVDSILEYCNDKIDFRPENYKNFE